MHAFKAIAAITLASFCASQTTHAQSPVNEYYIVSARMTDLLATISKDTGSHIEFASDVPLNVASIALNGTAEQMIGKLAKTYNLTYFTFNGRNYLGPANDQQTRIIANNAYEYEELRDAIMESGVDLQSAIISRTPNPRAFVITAPPKLVGIVEALVEALPDTAEEIAPPPVAPRTITIMRGI